MTSPTGEDGIQVTSPPGSNKNFNYLVAALIIVFVIVLLEVGFLFYKQRRAQTQGSLILEPALPPQPEEQGTRRIDVTEIETFLEARRDYNPPGVYKDANINWTIAGTVQGTSETGNSEDFGVEEPNFISVLTEVNEQTIIPFNDSEKDAAIFTLNGTSEIEFSDIQIGDFVTVKAKENLLDSSGNDTFIFEVRKDG